MATPTPPPKKNPHELTLAEALMQYDMTRANSTLRLQINDQAFHLATRIAFHLKQRVESHGGELSLSTELEQCILKIASILRCDTGYNGFLLAGNCGNGKTSLLQAVSDTITEAAQRGIIAEGEKTFNDGFPACRISRPQMRIIDARKICELAQSSPEEYNTLKHCFILGIDDLGTEPREVNHYGTISTPLEELLECRYNASLFTAITTNLPPKTIKAKYGERIADRFNEMICSFPFKNPSFRKPK